MTQNYFLRGAQTEFLANQTIKCESAVQWNVGRYVREDRTLPDDVAMDQALLAAMETVVCYHGDSRNNDVLE